MMNNIHNLEELWNYTGELSKTHFPDNDLMPILGGGKEKNPKLMIVFINPTIRNISSDRNWNGPRFPFIGRKRPWDIFYDIGLFDAGLMYRIKNTSYWSLDLTEKVLRFMRNNGLYFTNLVKNTGHNADLPNAKQIKLYLPILLREIELVGPEYIIAFGSMVIKALTKQSIKLFEYYESLQRTNKVMILEIKTSSGNFKVVPCYYPIGRGNTKRAAEILKKFLSQYK